MSRCLALFLTVAGCTVPPPVEEPAHIKVVHICPAPPDAPKPLPKIVTTEQLRAWAEATEKARVDTVEALRKCRRVRMVDQN